jgi:hypothetical protein
MLQATSENYKDSVDKVMLPLHSYLYFSMKDQKIPTLDSSVSNRGKYDIKIIMYEILLYFCLRAICVNVPCSSSPIVVDPTTKA